MFKISCNLEKPERRHRIVIGSILVLGGIFGLGRSFLILAGLIILIEGIIGWCGLPILFNKYFTNSSSQIIR